MCSHNMNIGTAYKCGKTLHMIFDFIRYILLLSDLNIFLRRFGRNQANKAHFDGSRAQADSPRMQFGYRKSRFAPYSYWQSPLVPLRDQCVAPTQDVGHHHDVPGRCQYFELWRSALLKGTPRSQRLNLVSNRGPPELWPDALPTKLSQATTYLIEKNELNSCRVLSYLFNVVRMRLNIHCFESEGPIDDQ